MGYLNELLSKNPLVIDGDTIRPHHKYTDDLYTGGIKMGKCEKCLYHKSKTKCGECGRLSNAMDNNPMFTPNTNYDRIKSMSVEEMAVNLAKIQCDAIEQTVPIKVTEEARKEQYELCKQWLLQEVSEDE